MVSTHITFNTFPIIPSTDPSSMDSAVLISGSSFKPLQLSNHPWVRAHLRHAARDPQKPHLSFLTQYRHMYGPDWFTQSEDATRVASETYRPEALQTNVTSTSVAETDAGSSDPVQSTHASTSRDVSNMTFPLQPHKSLDIEPDSRSLEIHRPAMTRSVSAPGRVASPSLSDAHVQEATQPRRLSHKGKRHRPNRVTPPPLGIAAFSSAFSDILSTSENIFGYARPANHTPSAAGLLPRNKTVDKTRCGVAGE